MNWRSAHVFRWLESHRWQALAVTLPVILMLHFVMAAMTINRSNQDWHRADQMAEVWLSRAARNDPVPLRTDGIRHPLWSWTVSKLHANDEVVFFRRGKWLNTAFCMVFLAALGVGVARWLDPLATANLLLLASLGILLVRGTYFQPEPFYYVFFFLAGLLAVRVLRQANAWHFAALGVAGGLAFLAKPSFEPFLLAFCATFAFRLGLSLFFDQKNWRPLKNSLLLAAGLGLMALIVLPLGRYSREAYGKAFFGYPKFWMWMDDFRTEAYPFAATNWSRAHLEKLCPRRPALRRMVFPAPYPGGGRHAVVERHARSGGAIFFPRAEACLARVFVASQPEEMASAARSSRSLPSCACGTVRGATLASAPNGPAPAS